MTQHWLRRAFLHGVLVAFLGGDVAIVGFLLGGVYETVAWVIAMIIWAGGFPLLKLIESTRRSK